MKNNYCTERWESVKFELREAGIGCDKLNMRVKICSEATLYHFLKGTSPNPYAAGG